MNPGTRRNGLVSEAVHSTSGSGTIFFGVIGAPIRNRPVTLEFCSMSIPVLLSVPKVPGAVTLEMSMSFGEMEC